MILACYKTYKWAEYEPLWVEWDIFDNKQEALLWKNKKDEDLKDCNTRIRYPRNGEYYEYDEESILTLSLKDLESASLDVIKEVLKYV